MMPPESAAAQNHAERNDYFPRVAVGVLKQMELIIDNCRNDAKSRIAGN